MKTLLRTLIVATLLFCTSCVLWGGIPKKLDAFVEKTEKECESYTQEDWEKSRNEYRALVDEYKNSRKAFSDKDKELALRAMGRYNALLLKNGIVAGAGSIKEFSEMLPGFLSGLAEGLEANSEEIGKALKALVDTNKINGAIQSLGSALEKIMGGTSE